MALIVAFGKIGVEK